MCAFLAPAIRCFSVVICAWLPFWLYPLQAMGQPIRVRIVRADEMRPAAQGATSVFRLLGRVVMQHDSAMMWCDSAHVNQHSNTFDAYGQVRIHSKELKIRGHTLYYDGNTGCGRMLGLPVVLRDTVQDATLWSDELFFDTRNNTAEYQEWGRIRSGENEMESRKGLYESNGKLATVWRSVTFRGEKVVAYTDSLRYEHAQEVAHFWGPTRLYESNRMAYGLEGWYDQQREVLEVRRSVVAADGENYLFADYLYADKAREFLDAQGHVALIDSTGHNRLYTQRLRYWHGVGLALADVDPLLFSIDTTMRMRDTLVLRADTVRVWREVHEQSKELPDSGAMVSRQDHDSSVAERNDALGVEGRLPPDTAGSMGMVQDTVRFARLVGSVRGYRRDVQMVADTMYVSGLDSSITMVRRPYPYLWSDSMQANALRIVAYVGRNQLDSILLHERAIVALQGQHGGYDQIGAELLRGHFADSELRTAWADGDARMVYYMVDRERVEGINRVECPSFRAEFESNQPVGVTFFSKPHSSMLPIRDAKEEDRLLYGFSWQDQLRPVGQGAVRPAWLNDYNYYQPAQHAALGYRLVERATLAKPVQIPRGVSNPEDFEEQQEASASEGQQDVRKH